jgi:ribokinase
MARVVVLGSLNVDLVTRLERHPRPGETLLGDGLHRLAGGKGANQAMAAARSGASVRMVGAVGDDEAGTAYRRRLETAGIDTSALLARPDEPTGTALIAVDAAGENTIIVVPGANGTVGAAALEALEMLGLGPGDVLLVQLEIPLATVATACRAAHERGARVVLNSAPYADLSADVVATADPLVANEHEAELLARAGLVPASLLVTLGAGGARWGGLVLPATEVPAAHVQDTTGAGDAFCGALAAALAQGLDDEAALRSALDAGADAVRHHGAQPDPTLR